MTPFTPPSGLELIAHLRPPGPLVCRTTYELAGRHWTAGRQFAFNVMEYPFRCQRVVTYNGRLQRQNVEGSDICVMVRDDLGLPHRFMEYPMNEYDHPVSLLWHIFERPIIETVCETII